MSSDKARLDHIDRNISFIKLNNWNEVAAVLLTFVEEKERIFVLEKLKKHEKLKTMNLDTRVVWNCFLEKDSIETVKKILFANIPNTDSDTDSEIEYDSDSSSSSSDSNNEKKPGIFSFLFGWIFGIFRSKTINIVGNRYSKTNIIVGNQYYKN